MSKKIHFKIIIHERVVYEGDVDAIYAPGASGRFGILPDHIPFMSALNVGVTKIENEGKAEYMTTMGGVFQVKDNVAVILTDVAERGSEIDAARARAAKERAKARLKAHQTDTDYLKAQFALAKALARLQACQEC